MVTSRPARRSIPPNLPISTVEQTAYDLREFIDMQHLIPADALPVERAAALAALGDELEYRLSQYMPAGTFNLPQVRALLTAMHADINPDTLEASARSAASEELLVLVKVLRKRHAPQSPATRAALPSTRDVLEAPLPRQQAVASPAATVLAVPNRAPSPNGVAPPRRPHAPAAAPSPPMASPPAAPAPAPAQQAATPIARAPSPADMAKRQAELSVACAERGSLQEALAHAEQACSLQPRNAAYQFNVGNTLGRLGRHREAMQFLEAAANMHSRNGKYQAEVAKNLFFRGAYLEAEIFYHRALNAEPYNAQYLEGLAQAQRRQTVLGRLCF